MERSSSQKPVAGNPCWQRSSAPAWGEPLVPLGWRVPRLHAQRQQHLTGH